MAWRRDRPGGDGGATHGRGPGDRGARRRLRAAPPPRAAGSLGGGLAHSEERSREGGSPLGGPGGATARGREGQAAARTRRARRGRTDARSAARALSVQAVPQEEWLEGALVPLAASPLHL